MDKPRTKFADSIGRSPPFAVCGAVASQSALDGREVRVFPSAAGTTADVSFGETGMNAVNVLSAGPLGTLLATDGSRAQPVARWGHDLMEKGRTGRLLSLDPTTQRVTEIASGLAFAFGACQAGAEILVSESWRHR